MKPFNLSINPEGVITGHVIKYGREHVNADGERMVFKAGCFERSLAECRDVSAVWNADSAAVLGSTADGSLLLSEDADGLSAIIIPPDTQAGRDAAEAVAGDTVAEVRLKLNVIETADMTDAETGVERSEIVEAELLGLSLLRGVTIPTDENEIRERLADAGLTAEEIDRAARAVLGLIQL